MAASKGLGTKKPPVAAWGGMVRIENAHMPARLAPDEKVVLEKFSSLYPKEVSGCTGRQLAARYPQSITVGREATYFIPASRFAAVKGKAFALPRSLVAGLRQELSPKDLHNRVYHNRTYPGCMIDAWDLAQKREKENARYGEEKPQAMKARPGK
ncbi:MAG: hypothetical protein WCX64_05260 [Candidatus Micrarchaeia archaeon]